MPKMDNRTALIMVLVMGRTMSGVGWTGVAGKTERRSRRRVGAPAITADGRGSPGAYRKKGLPADGTSCTTHFCGKVAKRP